jgi:hypothetical protein
MIIVITFIKAFIKDQIHWLISFLSKPKSKFNGVWIRFLNQIVKTQKFEIPNVLSRVDVSSKCNQKPLNQIPSILKNFTHIPPNSIEFRILELPPFFKIEILFGILKSSNEESCSLLNYLPIHIFFQIFRFQEVHLLFQSSQSDLKLLWLNRKIYYSFGPAHAHANRGPGTRPPFPPPLLARCDGRARPLSPLLGHCRPSVTPLVTVLAPLHLHLAPAAAPYWTPPFSSLSASVQAVWVPFRCYHRVELPTAARLATSPPLPSDQTGACRCAHLSPQGMFRWLMTTIWYH